MPIFRQMGNVRSFAGTAFCIENYLVTAGHVLTTDATYYVLNGDNWHAEQYDMLPMFGSNCPR